MGDTSSVRSSTSAFSESTKMRVTDLNGDGCWACGSEGVDIYHVVAREDRQVSIPFQGCCGSLCQGTYVTNYTNELAG